MYKILLAMALTLCCCSTQAQDLGTALYGQVVLKGKSPKNSTNWYMSVWAAVALDQPLGAKKKYTRELYVYRTQPMSKKARVVIEAQGYHPIVSQPHLIADPYSVAITPAIKPNPVGWLAKVEDELLELKQAVERTNSFDLFNWNVALLSYLKRKEPQNNAKVQTFLADLEKQSLPYVTPQMATLRSQFASIITLVAREEGEKVNADPVKLIALAKDKTLFPGIRAETIDALTTLPLEAENKRQLIAFLRAEMMEPEALLLRAAKVALAKLGEPKDRDDLIEDLKSEDRERVLAALLAIRKARLSIAQAELARLANNEDAEIAEASKFILEENVPADARMIYSSEQGVAKELRLNVDSSLGDKTWVTNRQDDEGRFLEATFNKKGVNYMFFTVGIATPNKAERATWDITGYNELVLTVSGETTSGASPLFEVGLKEKNDPDNGAEPRQRIDTLPPNQWRTIRIPLASQINPPLYPASRFGSVFIPFELVFNADFPAQKLRIRRIYLAK